jgi:hypothetical protein
MAHAASSLNHFPPFLAHTYARARADGGNFGNFGNFARLKCRRTGSSWGAKE